MKKFELYLILFLINAMPISGQRNEFIFKATIRDSSTQVAIPNVKIYCISKTDTTMTTSSDGKIDLMVGIGTKLHFRKPGFAWQTVKINDKITKEIFLVPSKSHQKDIGIENYSSTILTYDGEIVPLEQWDDVCSINRDEIASVATYSKNGKNRIVFLSKP